MDAAAHWITLLTIVLFPPVMCSWLLIHPLTRQWRRLGPVATYAIVFLVIAALAALIASHRSLLLRIHFALDTPLIVLGGFWLAVGAYIGNQRGRQLTWRALFGVQQLSRTTEPGALVTDGIYARMRHPRYVEVWLMLAGLALVCNYVALYALTGIAIPLIYVIVVLEERELRDRFGVQHARYCRGTPRFPRGTIAVLVVIPVVLGGLALFWTFYNPDVPFAEPHVVAREPRRAGEVTIVLGGDFAPTDAAMPSIEKYGYRFPYLSTADIFGEADIAFANLEAPITDTADRLTQWTRYSYQVDPSAVDAWQWLGLDLVGLANNHARDHGDAGIHDTVRHLDEHAIAHIGAGTDETEARRPVIFDVGGTRIGFLAYLEHQLIYSLYLNTFAVGDRPGCAQLNRKDVAADVRRLRPLVDILIVSVHWGGNYEPISSTQQEYGRWMADLGVDVVAGHHSHDVQGVETRGKSVILYSLGNYAWGAPGHGHMRIGLLAQLRITPRSEGTLASIASVDLLPIVTQNRIVKFQPRRIRATETGWLDPFLADTAARGTSVTVDGTVIHVDR